MATINEKTTKTNLYLNNVKLVKHLTKVPRHYTHTFFTFECKISEAHSLTHFHHLNTRNFFQGPSWSQFQQHFKRSICA